MDINKNSSSTPHVGGTLPSRGEARAAHKANSPAMAGDSLTLSGRKPAAREDGKFSWGMAAKHFGKGLISPITSLVDGFKKAPLKTSLLLGGGILALGAATVALPAALGAVALTAPLAPFVAPAVLLGTGGVFAALGATKVVQGGAKAAELHRQGQYDGAEKAFEQIGAGTFDVATSAVSVAQGIKGVRAAAAARRLTATTAAPTAVSELERQRSLLTMLEQRLAQLKPGTPMSTAGEQQVIHHLDWTFKSHGFGVLPDSKKQAIIELLNSGKPTNSLRTPVYDVLREGLEPYQMHALSKDLHYTLKHLVDVRVQDLLEGVNYAYPLFQNLKLDTSGRMAELAKLGSRQGPHHPAVNLGDSFVEAVATGDLGYANKVIALAKSIASSRS